MDKEELRRSKRNKFHLNVAAIMAPHSEKRYRSVTPPAPQTAESEPKGKAKPPTAQVSKRARKVPVRHLDFVSDEHIEPELDDEAPVLTPVKPEFFCVHCPAHFPSRRGLANHSKLHGSQKKYHCDQCDMRVVSRFGDIWTTMDGCKNSVKRTAQKRKTKETAEVKPEDVDPNSKVKSSLPSSWVRESDARRFEAGKETDSSFHDFGILPMIPENPNPMQLASASDPTMGFLSNVSINNSRLLSGSADLLSAQNLRRLLERIHHE